MSTMQEQLVSYIEDTHALEQMMELASMEGRKPPEGTPHVGMELDT